MNSIDEKYKGAIPKLRNKVAKDQVQSQTEMHSILKSIEVRLKNVENDTSDIHVKSSAKSKRQDLCYKEGQWSPLNTEGKKAYDREFLLAIRDKYEYKMPDYLKKPRNQKVIRKVDYFDYGVEDDNTRIFLSEFSYETHYFSPPLVV